MAKTKKQVTLNDETIAVLEQEGLGSLSTGIEMMFRDWKQGAPAHHAKPTSRLAADHAPDPIPADPRNPTNNWNIAQGLKRKDAEAAIAAEKERRRPFLEFQSRIEHAVETQEAVDVKIAEYKAEYADRLTEAEQMEIIHAALMDLDLLATRTRHMKKYEQDRIEDMHIAKLRAQGASAEDIQADYDRRHGLPTEKAQQTLKLSPATLKALKMDSTPDHFTDEQIRESNALYAMTPAQREKAFETPAQTPKHEPTLSELWAANPLEVPEDDA